MGLREEDFYSWCKKNAQVLRSGILLDVDIDHLDLAEELELMSASIEREIANRLSILIAHLLKIEYEPQRKSRSWILTIKEQRLRIKYLIKDNPGVKQKLDYILQKGYDYSISEFERDTLMDGDILPKECPYSLDNLLDENFYG